MKKHKPLYIESWLKRRELHPTRIVVEDGRAVLYIEPEARAWRGSCSDVPARKAPASEAA